LLSFSLSENEKASLNQMLAGCCSPIGVHNRSRAEQSLDCEISGHPSGDRPLFFGAAAPADPSACLIRGAPRVFRAPIRITALNFWRRGAKSWCDGEAEA